MRLKRSPIPIPVVIALLASSIVAAKPRCLDEDLIRKATLTVEATQTRPVTPGVSSTFQVIAGEPVVLSAEAKEHLRSVIVAAWKRFEREQQEAVRKGLLPGGVPGCMSGEYSIGFQLGDRVCVARLHLCDSWIEWRDGSGFVILDAVEQKELTRLLRCAEPCGE